ncbi:MAG: carboxypeptidase regulatory-like domain-containing protein, partial [Jatrophihabitans sp.]
MTGPRFVPESGEPAPAVLVDPELRTGAGDAATLVVMLTNRGAEPRSMILTVLGLDTAWLPAPSRTRPMMPGESLAVELTIIPASGTVPARYPFAVAVQSIEPASGAAVATSVADIVLAVDEPSQIAIELDPAAANAVFSRKVRLRLHNSGPTPTVIGLEVQAPASTRVRLSHNEVVVDPGETVALRGEVRVVRPRLFGQRARHTYLITAHSAGSPRHVEGSLTVRAALGPAGTKMLAMVAVVAVWLALAIIFIPKLANHVKSGTNVAARPSSTAPASPGATKSGAKNAGKSGSGPGSNKSGTGAPAPGSSAASASSVQFNGTVSGASPGGVTVALAKTSLVDEGSAGVKTVGFSADSFRSLAIGKIPGSAVLLTPPRTVSQNRSTSTGVDGAWSFPRVPAPGYYELTFSKPGYQTERYVLDSSTAVATQPLKVELVPGQGSLHGSVLGPGGAIGAAQVTITDGTNTITTSSNSKGAVGDWTIDGLSTPASYLVTAAKNGMSTESALINLGAGGSSQADLTLTAGVATLSGTVQGPDNTGAMSGLGNVAITVTDGSISRTASTVTTGSLVGHFALPDLAPGSYTVTVQADGYLTQTRQVTITRGHPSAVLNTTLNSSAAVVTGDVSGALFDDVTGDPLTRNGTYLQGPVNGAGLILTNATNTYKITSGSDGAFRFNGVAPGNYVLSAQYAGLITSYRSVQAVVGKITPAVAFVLAPQSVTNTSTITGYLGSATTSGGTLACPTTTVPAPPAGAGGAPTVDCSIFFTLTDSDNAPVPTRLPGGTDYLATSTTSPATSGPTPYTLSAQDGLAPGLYHLTIGSTGYLPATIAVRVALNAVTVAPQVNLYPANIISGTINAFGDVTRDGAVDAAQPKTYVNCVWAIPEGFSDPTGKITQPPT